MDDVLYAAALALTPKKLDLSPQSGVDEYSPLPEEVTPVEDGVLGISPEIVYSKTSAAEEN